MSRRIGYRAKKSILATELAAQAEGETAVKAVSFNVTDSARQLAAEHNINLADLTGTGVDGRITKGDVELAIAAAGAAHTGGEQ